MAEGSNLGIALVFALFVLGLLVVGAIAEEEQNHCLSYSAATGECLESITTEEIVDTYLKEHGHAQD